ncbi:MAG: hypothetical protein AB7U41_02535 [Dongiaceae bacterium]
MAFLAEVLPAASDNIGGEAGVTALSEAETIRDIILIDCFGRVRALRGPQQADTEINGKIFRAIEKNRALPAGWKFVPLIATRDKFKSHPAAYHLLAWLSSASNEERRSFFIRRYRLQLNLLKDNAAPQKVSELNLRLANTYILEATSLAYWPDFRETALQGLAFNLVAGYKKMVWKAASFNAREDCSDLALICVNEKGAIVPGIMRNVKDANIYDAGILFARYIQERGGEDIFPIEELSLTQLLSLLPAEGEERRALKDLATMGTGERTKWLEEELQAMNATLTPVKKTQENAPPQKQQER